MSLAVKESTRDTLVRLSAPAGWVVLAITFITLVSRIMGQAVLPGDPEPWPLLAFADYRDALELPAQDLVAGLNPYDLPAFLNRHQGSQPFNVYLPQHFVFFGWLAFLPRPLAVVALGLLNTASAGWLVKEGLVRARLSLLLLPWVLSFLLIRGPLFMALRSGQIAIVVAAAAWLTLRPEASRLRPLAICLCLIKPQVGIPVLIIALCLGQLRTVLWGSLITIGMSLPALLIILSNTTPINFVKDVLENLSYSSGDEAFLSGALDIPTNIRVLGLFGSGVGVWVTTVLVLLLLGISIVLLRRSSRGDNFFEDIITWLAILGSVVILPNQRYAAAVILPLLIPALWPFRVTTERSRRSPMGVVYWIVGALLLIAIIRSETLELRLGFPEFVSASLTGWLFDVGFILLLVTGAILIVRESTSSKHEKRRPT